jgi:multiple antibiotic resistance protein
VSDYLQAVATVLSLMNPVICAAMFSTIEQSRPPAAKLGDGTKAVLAILTILVAAALVGSTLLRVFGVSIAAFQVAGGGVLVWMGFTMLRGLAAGAKSPAAPAAPAGSASLAPLILFAASPGTITGVITLSVTHSGHELPLTALVAVGVAVAVTWLVMIVTAGVSKDRTPGLMHVVVTQVMGLIVFAMGVQFALTGIRTFFGST